MIDRRAVRVLLASRELLRDAAVAQQQAEQARRARAASQLAEAERSLTCAHASAASAMLAAPCVEALALAARSMDELRLRSEELARVLAEAERRLERATLALRERSRQAHGAARLAERASQAHSQKERRLEQLQHDELSRRAPPSDEPR